MTVFANAEVILPQEVVRASVHVDQGKIQDIVPGQQVPAGALDCQGDYLAPGLIELHTDNLERHMKPRPGVDWPHSAAVIAHDAELAGAGITTVFDAIRVGSLHTSADAGYGRYAREMATELKVLKARDALKISHRIHLRAEICSETLLEELDEFTPEDRIGLISLMDHTPGQRQFRDVSQLEHYLMGKHGYTQTQFEQHVVHLQGLQDKFGVAHEQGAVAEAKRLGAMLASHDDTLAEHVERSALHGIRLAEFPTTVEAAQACHQHDIQVMMGAPNLIRGGSHSGNVAAHELAGLDLLDIVSSDYVPAGLLTAVMRLADLWKDLPRAVNTATRNPAAGAGLADRGSIEPGLRADLIRFRTLDGDALLRGVWVQGQRVS